jgi:hypothetical protein
VKVTVIVLSDVWRTTDIDKAVGPSPVATNRNVRVIASDKCPPTSVSGRAPMTIWQLGLASVTTRLMLATRRASVL